MTTSFKTLAGAVLIFCLLPVWAAGPPDGIHLSVDKGAGGAAALLSWDTGPYTFSVYRSTSAANVLDPGNKVAETTDHSFSDTPPPGHMNFYNVRSSCAYDPPERCNGIDDDCDGIIDPPGSEAYCNLPNATPACSGGACVVASCNTGYGDCNGIAADGCETSTNIAQSTSPASIWANDPNPNQDLKPGYIRVTGITNCGACGVTCDDGNTCTTDLCVPKGSAGSVVGACAHYNRGQCSEARCGGMQLPPGTPPPADGECTSPDTDGDGLPDAWERAQSNPYTNAPQAVGIDLNCDGEISDSGGDMVYSEPPDPDVPDIYVQYDYMEASPDPASGETASHAPPPEAVDATVAAFARRGISLHIDPVHHVIPHASVLYFPSGGSDACASGDAVSFYDVKGANFDPKRRYAYRYVVFGHNSCYGLAAESDTTGISELPGNDSIVTLGSLTYAGPTATEQRIRENAGTLMHEVGHQLGLKHPSSTGACDPPPCPGDAYIQKPNYFSVMNYRYQLSGISTSATSGSTVPLALNSWRVDYSYEPLGTLTESNLDETAGVIGAPPPRDRDIVQYDCLGYGPYLGPAHGSIDWNCDSVFSAGVSADLNSDGSLTDLGGYNDWISLRYDFQCEPAFANGTPPPPYVTPGELTVQLANSRHLRAFHICQSNAECDDGNYCNGVETCSLATGQCLAGQPPSCDDGNPCTADSCSTATNSCVHDPNPSNGSPCSAGEFCVVGKTCSNGVCSGGAPRSCDDGLACTSEVCNEALHACVTTCTAQPCWVTPLGSGVASAPASDSPFHPASSSSRSYVAQGTKLFALRNSTDAGGPAGSIVWTWNQPTGSTIQNFPSPVPLSNGTGEYIFLGGLDGYLYKIRTDDGATTGAVDTRRASCATDQLLATPTVQLYEFSNAAFRTEMDSHPGHPGDDVVFVPTRTGCGDSSSNRVIAYYASDLSMKGVFNSPLAYKVDFGSDGCALDYTNNRIYCGTNLTDGYAQNSLFALNTINVGAPPVWSGNAGSVWNRPQLANGRLYVGTKDGSIMAYDPNGSATGDKLPLWDSPIVVPGGITRNIWVESRAGGYSGKILAVDSSGHLSCFTDKGNHASLDWSVLPPAGTSFTSTVNVEPTLGKLYIGRNDGSVQQIDLSTGTPEASLPVAPAGSTVFDPTLDSRYGSTIFDRLLVVGGNASGSFAQFCVAVPPPPGACLQDSDCASFNGGCDVGACNSSTGACYRHPLPNGTPCDDGKACSLNDTCQAGVCKAGDYSGCPCTGTGDAACAFGLTCCGGMCVNLLSGQNSCGACNVACPSDRMCSQGSCVVAPASCQSPNAGTLAGAGPILTGVDAVDFDRGAALCYAYASTYRNPSVSPVLRVDPAGGVTSLTNPSTDAAPLNGIAAARQGNQIFAVMIDKPFGSFPQTTPGVIDGTFSPARSSVDATTSATFASQPFAATIFNQGPVGPAFDYQSYTPSGPTKLYLGNWQANGDVRIVQQQCPICPWLVNSVPVVINPPGDRITAIAYAPGSPIAPVRHSSLYVAHGSIVSIFDVDTSTQTNIDLAGVDIVPPATVNAILSIAVHPVYGDVYIEARDTLSRREILEMRQQDRTLRNQHDVCTDLKLSPVAPATFSNDGRLVLEPSGLLLRVVPASNPNGPASFLEYGASR